MTVEKKGKYKLVAPDGGWGYIICFAAILVDAPIGGILPSFGMLYNEMMMDIGIDTTGIGLLTGIGSLSFCIAGFFTSSLLKVLSFRQLAFISVLLVNIGTISLPFVHSIVPFVLCQSVLESIGFGILINLVFAIIRDYFVVNRLFAMSLVQTTNGLAALCMPMIAKAAAQTYGHRGMLIIVAATTLHMSVGVCLMQPVTWHMKKVEESEESQEMITFTNELPTAKITEAKPTFHVANEKNLSKDKVPLNKENVPFIRKVFHQIIDVQLMKEFLLSVENIGIAVALFANIMYLMMLPRAFYAMGRSQDYVAWSLSLIAFGDVAARITLIIFSKYFVKLGCRELYAVGTAIAFLSRVGVMLSRNSSVTLAFLTLVGVGRCCIVTLIPVILADTVSRKNFTGAMGINMLTVGILDLALGPAIGACKNLTGSYEVVLWIPTVVLLGVTIFLIISLYIRKVKQRKIQKVSENC